MTVKKIRDSITPTLAQIQQSLSKLPQEAYDFWVDTTPIKSGNARRRTRLQGNTINANYPYAVPLDEGHSKQAPTGMSKPTDKFIEKRLRQILRK